GRPAGYDPGHEETDPRYGHERGRGGAQGQGSHHQLDDQGRAPQSSHSQRQSPPPYRSGQRHDRCRHQPFPQRVPTDEEGYEADEQLRGSRLAQFAHLIAAFLREEYISTMASTIRLARHGAKKHPFYRIVVADRRSPRSGRLDQIGTYDPSQDPPKVTIE